jgi:hypothetical protein
VAWPRLRSYDGGSSPRRGARDSFSSGGAVINARRLSPGNSIMAAALRSRGKAGSLTLDGRGRAIRVW